MDTVKELGGVVVAIIAFVVMFFGFVSVPDGSSLPAVVLVVGFMSAGVGFAFRVVFSVVFSFFIKSAN